ncbi:MAG: hypothetical protein R2880_21360, partial [Deinococcales bacterium]
CGGCMVVQPNNTLRDVIALPAFAQNLISRPDLLSTKLAGGMITNLTSNLDNAANNLNPNMLTRPQLTANLSITMTPGANLNPQQPLMPLEDIAPQVP